MAKFDIQKFDNAFKDACKRKGITKTGEELMRLQRRVHDALQQYEAKDDLSYEQLVVAIMELM